MSGAGGNSNGTFLTTGVLFLQRRHIRNYYNTIHTWRRIMKFQTKGDFLTTTIERHTAYCGGLAWALVMEREMADMGTLGRQAGIVGVDNKLARMDRLLPYFIPILFVYSSV